LTKKSARSEGGTDLKTIQEQLFKLCKAYVQDIETEEALRPIIGAKVIKK
jgi:hypothetical protein